MKAKPICTKLISVIFFASSVSEVQGLVSTTTSVTAKLKEATTPVTIKIEEAATSVTTKLNEVDYLSLATYASATICAGIEIAEDVSEVGHGHGLVLLTLSRIFKGVAEVRRVTSWKGEIIMKDIKPKGFAAEIFEKNMNFLSSTYLTSSLAVLALLSAFKEVSESVEIGGHHGMVFLALHDILELTEESTSATEVKVLENVTNNSALKLMLIAGAIAAAGVETIQSLDAVGAHNGVLLLASLRTFKTFGIFRRVRKEAKEKEE